MIVVNYPDERLWRILVVAFPCGIGAEQIASSGSPVRTTASRSWT